MVVQPVHHVQFRHDSCKAFDARDQDIHAADDDILLLQLWCPLWLCSYGFGQRISIAHTRAIVDAIHSGDLEKGAFHSTPVFHLAAPTTVPGVPNDVLMPETQWGNRGAFYDTLQSLARMFMQVSACSSPNCNCVCEVC